MHLSIVLPVYNEERHLPALLGEIVAVFRLSVGKPYEIIVVDDASTDQSVHLVEEFRRQIGDPPLLGKIRILLQPARSGQSAALMRGLAEARGSMVISMDADGQYDPADIPRMLELMQKFDMVCGVRDRRADGLFRLFCSKIANGFRNLVTGDATTDSGCVFRVMKRECIPAFLPVQGKLYGCEFFYHPLLARNQGFRVSEISVRHRSRSGGKSNYRLIRGRLGSGLLASFRIRKFARK